MDRELGYRLIELRKRIVSSFDAESWEELGLLTGMTEIIVGHDRLLRSLHWNDEDYAGNVLTVIRRMVTRDPSCLKTIDDYLAREAPGDEEFISAKPAERRITFAPHVFQIPEGPVEIDLASAMMPFHEEFRPVYEAIRAAATDNRLRCLRADDIWEDATIIQDVFNLLYRSQVVICDFSGRNPNVMYEAGIAHTLGKHVVPITQSLNDVPFDLQHHRVLRYLPNEEGFRKLRVELAKKLQQFKPDPSIEEVPF